MEPPMNTFPTQQLITGEEGDTHVIPQQHVFLVHGEEVTARDKAYALAAIHNARTHLQEGGIGCHIHHSGDGGTTSGTGSGCSQRNTGDQCPPTGNTPKCRVYLHKAQCGSQKDQWGPSTDAGVASAAVPAQLQHNFSLFKTISDNFFTGLATLAQFRQPQLTGTPRFRRYAKEEAPESLSELLKDRQTCEMCGRGGPVRVGKALLSERDLATSYLFRFRFLGAAALPKGKSRL